MPPIKNDDARLDFYTVYKKEATEYDTNYVKKYDEDLNSTLIFVGGPTPPFILAAHLIRPRRRVCSPPSVQPSSSMSSQSSNPIQANGPQLSYGQSLSP